MHLCTTSLLLESVRPYTSYLAVAFCNGLQAHEVIVTDVQASVQLRDTCKAADQRLQQLADEISQHRQTCLSVQVCNAFGYLLCLDVMAAHRRA